MMESPFLRLDDMQWKIVQGAGEVALAGTLSNCWKWFQAHTRNFRF